MSVKVFIEMDEGWSWWPVASGSDNFFGDVPPTLEISDELLEEFKSVESRWYDLQAKLEQLYRIQEGLEPFNMPIPEHKVLEK